MSASDRVHWDMIYRERGDIRFPDPDPLLYLAAPPLRAGETASALDLASGLGQNGLWLAAQNYRVDLIDVSRVALSQARTEATRRSLHLVNFFQLDLESARLEHEAYDLVCVFRFLNRSLLQQLRAAIKPGGRIVYQTFNVRFLEQKPDMNPQYLLRLGELAGVFGDWHILRSSEPTHVSQLIAIKPE
jgi:SAM-dependent methyltransferase